MSPFDLRVQRAKADIESALRVPRGSMGRGEPPQRISPRPAAGLPLSAAPQSPLAAPQLQLGAQPAMPMQGAPTAPQPQMPQPPAPTQGGLQAFASGGGAWTRKEGKNPEGGLNAKGRASLRAQGHDIKPPVSAEQAAKSPKAAARRKSFCARMSGMPGPMEDEKGRPTRKALSLRKWDCRAEGGQVEKKPFWETEAPEGKSKKLAPKRKAAAKRRAKAAGRPYPNLIDNAFAARKKG